MSPRLGLLAIALACAACGKGPHLNGADAPKNGGDGGSYDAPAGWQTLITLSWNLSAGEQEYVCNRIQVPNDMYINAWSPIAPVGTHHQVLTIDPVDTETGVYDCDGESGTINGEMLFAAGVGTGQLTFPPGVAVHLTAGTWINLNLHLFDEQDNALNNTSGIQVQTVPASEVVNEADMVFSGTESIDVPSDGMQHTAAGGCTAPAEWHVFDLWPHEHQLGINQLITVNGSAIGNEPQTGWPFTFGDQIIYPETEVIPAGAQILTTCTYMFPAASCDYTTNTGCSQGTCESDDLCHVEFGQLTQDEMCFTGLYKYPTSGPDSTFDCVSQ